MRTDICVALPYGLVIIAEPFPHLPDDLGDFRIGLSRVLCYNGGMMMLPEENKRCRRCQYCFASQTPHA
jgi:hypothetical protein